MSKEITIQDLINNKIEATQSGLAIYENNSSIKDFSKITIKAREFGRIIFCILKVNARNKVKIETSNCSKYFHITFHWKTISDLPHTMNGIINSPKTTHILNKSEYVSSILSKEFEDVLLEITSIGEIKRHLRIPLVSLPESHSLLQRVS
jgi:hypothetical protein